MKLPAKFVFANHAHYNRAFELLFQPIWDI